MVPFQRSDNQPVAGLIGPDQRVCWQHMAAKTSVQGMHVSTLEERSGHVAPVLKPDADGDLKR